MGVFFDGLNLFGVFFAAWLQDGTPDPKMYENWCKMCKNSPQRLLQNENVTHISHQKSFHACSYLSLVRPGLRLVSLGIAWDRLGSLGIAWDRLRSLGSPWDGLGWLGLAWDRWGSLGIAWDRLGPGLGSPGIAGDRLRSRGIAWDRLGSLGDRLGSLGVAWGRLGSLGIAWDRLGSLGIAWDRLGWEASMPASCCPWYAQGSLQFRSGVVVADSKRRTIS